MNKKTPAELAAELAAEAEAAKQNADNQSTLVGSSIITSQMGGAGTAGEGGKGVLPDDFTPGGVGKGRPDAKPLVQHTQSNRGETTETGVSRDVSKQQVEGTHLETLNQAGFHDGSKEMAKHFRKKAPYDAINQMLQTFGTGGSVTKGWDDFLAHRQKTIDNYNDTLSKDNLTASATGAQIAEKIGTTDTSKHQITQGSAVSWDNSGIAEANEPFVANITSGDMAGQSFLSRLNQPERREHYIKLGNILRDAGLGAVAVNKEGVITGFTFDGKPQEIMDAARAAGSRLGNDLPAILSAARKR